MQVRRVLWRMPLEAKDTEPRSDDRFDLRITEEARVATTAFSLGPLHFQFHPHDVNYPRLKPRACKSIPLGGTAYDWPVDSGPAGYFNRREVIGVADAATLDTGELALRGTVPFVDTATSRTGARRVARVYRDYWHTCQRCLVLDKRTELGKRPAMQGGASGFSSRYPLADMRQIFQRNPARSA